MSNESKIINGLLNMGFSERQAKVYNALLNMNDASLADLHKHSGVPQNKISEVIQILVRNGICSEKKIKTRKYYNVISPKSSLKEKIIEMQETLSNSEKLVDEIDSIYRKKDTIKEPLDYIEVIRGNFNIHSRFCEIVRNSKAEILSFHKPPWAAVNDNDDDEQGKSVEIFHKNGGKSRGIYEISDEEDYLIDFLKRDSEVGEECRISGALPMKMFIFDRKLLLLAEASNDDNDNVLKMVLINQKVMVNAFIELFEFFWMKSEKA